MDHRLFVPALVVAQSLVAELIERLANTGDVAMAKNSKHAREEPLLPPIALAELRAQKADQGLGHREPAHLVSGLGIITSRTS